MILAKEGVVEIHGNEDMIKAEVCTVLLSLCKELEMTPPELMADITALFLMGIAKMIEEEEGGETTS